MTVGLLSFASAPSGGGGGGGSFNDDDEPTALNRGGITSGNPATAGAVYSWVGPLGGGANNGSPQKQSVTLGAPVSSMTISAPGTYSGLNLSDTLEITVSNVTIQHSYLSSATGDNVVKIGTAGIQNVIIEDCEIAGGGAAGNLPGQNGVFIVNNLGSGGVIVRRNNIHGVGSGVASGDAPYQVTHNWIHDLAGDPITHFNGIQDNGHTNHDGLPVLIDHNSINNNLQNQTDALMLTNLGDLTNVTVTFNWLRGAGLTSAGVVYVDGSSGTGPVSVTFNNNKVGPNTFGTRVFTRTGSASSYTLNHTGNTDVTTGASIDGDF